ncbi:MAG TPA: adenylate/guanylate cyclase domain-containing protein, partial [Afipia sp.]|nr:adenylate/guanylate cyclase domain-containing protein [Afipia sp.]
LGVLIAGLTPDPNQNVWTPIIFSAVFAIALNLLFAISNIIGPRAFLHLVTGRYHTPVEESRFVLFVDIAGSTALAERLGGLAI